VGDLWDDAAERRLRNAMRDSAGKGRRGTDRAVNRGNGQPGGCGLPALILLAGIAGLAVVLGVCGPVVYHVAAALLLAWPRRLLTGWSCSCGSYNDERAGTCAGCGKGRS
jgi:hypothetical protein